jgi:hypothetical protein
MDANSSQTVQQGITYAKGRLCIDGACNAHPPVNAKMLQRTLVNLGARVHLAYLLQFEEKQ